MDRRVLAGVQGRGRVRMSSLDWSVRSRISLELGPVELPGVGAFRESVVRLARQGAGARIGLALDGTEHWRLLDAELEQRVQSMVRVAPPGVGLRDWLEETWIPDLPIQFALEGNRAGFLADHRLLDANLASMLVPVLVDLAKGRPLPPELDRPTRHPLARALAHTFGAHPRTLFDLASQMRGGGGRDQQAVGAGSARPGPQLLLPPAGGSVGAVHRLAVLERPALASLRRWARGRAGFSTSLLILATSALRTAGVPVSDVGVMVVDLRRYLPEGTDTMANFITGARLPLAGPGSRPEELEARLEKALTVGKPLLATAAKAARVGVRRLSRPTAPEPRLASALDSAVAANVSLSNTGLLRRIEKLPWLAPPHERRVEVLGDAVDPSGIGFLTCMIDGRLRIGASFRGESFPVELVEEALRLMATDPAGVLDRY